MSQAFLDEYGLLPPLLEITHVNQTVEVLLMSLTCILNILNEQYKINKLVEAGLIGVARPLSGHEDEGVQERVAGIFLAISSCPGLEEWLVSSLSDQKSYCDCAYSFMAQLHENLPAILILMLTPALFLIPSIYRSKMARFPRSTRLRGARRP